MNVRKLSLFVTMLFIVFAFILSMGNGRVMAQSSAAVDKKAVVAAEKLKERAKLVQERRKARISHADRQAVADRAKAARAKAASGKRAPEKAGKGVTP